MALSATGHSLWLMPTGGVYKQLASIISSLSNKHSSLPFEPHVTLIGEVLGPREDMVSRTSRLAREISPFTIRLNGVGYLDEYFRCLFIQAKKTDELMKANLMARQEFGRQDDPEYFPHLSLMYGNFPEKTKQDIIGEIGKEFRLSFEIRSIHLFSSSGGPRDWYRVREFPLVGPSRQG